MASYDSERPSGAARLRRWLKLLVVLGLAVWWGLALWVVHETSRPRNRAVAERSEIAGHPVEKVKLRAKDKVEVSTWWVPVDREHAVILVAGIGMSREANLPAAEFYANRGWSVLMPDLRGTGESSPERITFGWYEARDIAACREFLTGRGFSTIGVHGRSLGAAAALYEASSDGVPAFLVLESPYSDIRLALAQRLPRVPMPELSFFPVRVLASIMLGVHAGDLRPVDVIRRCATPTLLLGGQLDRETMPSELEAMLQACPGGAQAPALLRGRAALRVRQVRAGGVAHGRRRLPRRDPVLGRRTRTSPGPAMPRSVCANRAGARNSSGCSGPQGGAQ
ncbi:MAG: hypothetical protein R3F30_11565 [Planctomycetota bacterium]